MKQSHAALLGAFILLLAGCDSNGEGELRQWMDQERAQAQPHVTPLTEPKQFLPQQYVAKGDLEPFSPQRLTQALKRDTNQLATNAALIAPELARRKEPLESFPLDSMIMVGSLIKAGSPTALVKVDSLIYQVKLGDYLGQNYGRITKISETAVQLREIAQDATGDWIERTASLELQEGVTK